MRGLVYMGSVIKWKGLVSKKYTTEIIISKL